MKENKYDDQKFFDQYSKMNRSVQGLDGAGEWYLLSKMLPDFAGKRVLDLGCGFGWHCRYAVEHGAASVTGTDISTKMIEKAHEINNLRQIRYMVLPMEEMDFEENSFDIVISSLAFHYIESFDEVVKRINKCLTKGGTFVFSAEHPVFTAQGTQDWHYDKEGNKLHWPVDDYYIEGKRTACFLGEEVVKYHKTFTTYLNSLLRNGFEIKEFLEAEPSREMLAAIPEMKDEMRRPMMFLISVVKK